MFRSQINQEFLESELGGASGPKTDCPPPVSTSEGLDRQQQLCDIADEVAKSPKLAKRGAVKELEKQPNGSFVASGSTLSETLSPKPARSSRTKVSQVASSKIPFGPFLTAARLFFNYLAASSSSIRRFTFC